MSALGVADVAVGIVALTCGTVVLWRRAERRVGVLMLAVSGTWFVGDLTTWLLFLHRGPLVHLHLSYPTGRLQRWIARVVVGVGYVWAVVDGWVDLPQVTAVMGLAVACAALDGFNRTSGPARRASVPALAAALAFAGALELSAANQLLQWDRALAVALLYDGVVAAMLTWLTLDLLRGRWTEATIADLVAELGSHGDIGLEGALRRALGDPSLRLVPGRVAAPDGKAAIHVDDGARTIATVVHDPELVQDPALVRGAAEAVRLAVSNGLLRDEAAARARELAGARRRIVETTDEQRTLVASAVGHGPVSHLERAAEVLRATSSLDAATAAAVVDLLAEVVAAQEQLDGFARGLAPGTDGDLETALRERFARHGVPVDLELEHVELSAPVSRTIWFVCAEAVTNAVKHAAADTIAVSVRQTDEGVTARVSDDGKGGAQVTGSGLRGLADRVEAVGGSLCVQSPPGGGTIVTASIPADRERP